MTVRYVLRGLAQGLLTGTVACLSWGAFAAGGIADRIAVWGYVLDHTPTACPFVIGKTEFSLFCEKSFIALGAFCV